MGDIMEKFIGLNMVGKSPAFQKVISQLKKFSHANAPILIEGETGTGKEVAARAVHYTGSRCDKPFIPVNCGALPDSLIENELFGHASGAYTDAKGERAGLVSQASGGTLFLDEVETLSCKGQVVLLRFLQSQEYRPLGGKEIKTANVRVVAATNASLASLVEQGQFRQDLFFRLNILSLQLPPLRERPGDAEILAEYFMRRFCDQYDQHDKYLLPSVRSRLRSYHWPGNVRELEAQIHRGFILAEENGVSLPDLQGEESSLEAERRKVSDRRANISFDTSYRQARAHVLEEFEKRYLVWLMEQTHGNVTLAAKKAGKERRALGKLIKKHGIDRNKYSSVP